MCWSKWAMMMMVKVMMTTVVVVDILGSHGQSTLQGVMKVWRENTNFGNVRNWEGLLDENCSGNIFSFPEWMDPSVVALPSRIFMKQIILPSNGHFVFQPGLTTLSDSGTCQHGREVKFRRTSRADWFNPKNWLLNDTSGHVVNNNAIPHVERIPCQYDSVKFPSRATFNLLISQKVSIGRFFLGEEEQSYTDIAVMMNSELGKLQFQKSSDVEFSLTKKSCSNDNDDECICDNYVQPTNDKICTLVTECENVAGKCANPIKPHGFCCFVCGFHIKITHNGQLKLTVVEDKLKKIQSDSGIWDYDYYVSRHRVKGAHIIVIPQRNGTLNQNLRKGTRSLADVVKQLKSVPQVEEVTWIGSWEEAIPLDVDKWEDGERSTGGLYTFIVILLLSILIIAVICFIFYRNKTQYPQISCARIIGMIPSFSAPNLRMPSMQMPTSSMPFPFRRGSAQAGGRTFGFARFTNERVSTVNIERSAAAAGASFERGDAVDETINPIDVDVSQDKVTDASQDEGFTQVQCDIVGVDVTDGSFSSVDSPLGIQAFDEFPSTEPVVLGLEKVESNAVLVDFDSEAKVATSGREKVLTSANIDENTNTQVKKGPAKPMRTKVDKINDDEHEPIYNEVFDAIGDSDLGFKDLESWDNTQKTDKQEE